MFLVLKIQNTHKNTHILKIFCWTIKDGVEQLKNHAQIHFNGAEVPLGEKHNQ